MFFNPFPLFQMNQEDTNKKEKALELEEEIKELKLLKQKNKDKEKLLNKIINEKEKELKREEKDNKKKNKEKKIDY